MHTIGEKRIRMLKPRDIKRPDNTIRSITDEYELSLLRDSIAASGVLQPLLVKRIKKGKYQLISGQRRLQAALMAGLRRVPCVVHNVDEATSIMYSLTENLQSQSISVFDQAKTVNMLISKKGMTLSETAAKLGVSQSSLYSKLQVLRLDERLAIRSMAAGLSENQIKTLLRIPKEGRAQALDTIISCGYNEKQSEEYVFGILNPPLSPKPILKQEVIEEEKEKPVRKTAIGDVRLFSNSLLKLVDTLKKGGVKANYRRNENEKYIEYKIRIQKETTDNFEFAQLKICQ